MIRSLQRLVRGFSGQKLISTHSGDLLAETEIHQIRRLARTRDGIRSFRVPSDLLSAEETRKFNYHVRQARGELLFARCWLLVEGETECWIFPAAARASGIHQMMLVVHGIHLVERMRLDELAAAGAYEFAFVVQPLKIEGATGSTVAPVAIFMNVEPPCAGTLNECVCAGSPRWPSSEAEPPAPAGLESRGAAGAR